MSEKSEGSFNINAVGLLMQLLTVKYSQLYISNAVTLTGLFIQSPNKPLEHGT
jgi:hypothetical protein